MEALKKHPFFLNIDYSKIFLIPPPFDFRKYKRSSLKEKLLG
jgi:hypothetical protein